MPDLLFVYGTLRGGSGHPMQAVLAAAGDRVGAASLAGKLYRVDWYPGLVLDDGEAPTQRVHGDVWTVNDRAALRELDSYEGSEYERRAVSVTMADGGVMRAFAYLYIGDTTPLDVVPSGDWLNQA